MEDQDHMEDSLTSVHKEEEEQHAPPFQEDTKKATTKSDSKLPRHQCHVMSHGVRHHSWIMQFYIRKCNVK